MRRVQHSSASAGDSPGRRRSFVAALPRALPRALAPFFVLGALMGCATTGGSGGESSEFLSDWRPPAGQVCAPSPEPGVLPPATVVVNPSEIGSAIRETLPDAEGFILLSLRQDSTGIWTRIAPIESDLASREQERVVELLGFLLTSNEVPPIRLRLDLGADEVAVRVGRQQHCGPAVANRDTYSRELTRLREHYRVETEVIIRVEVGEDGRPVEATLFRGHPNVRLNADVVAAASRLRFHPALNDRIPIAVTIQMPVAIRGRR